ncbi:hypothetical protein Tco_1408935 [Tanacetum coccineum]
MGKNSMNKRKQLEKYHLIYFDMGTSLSTGKLLTQKEAEREALAIDICRRYSLLEEERPVIETMINKEEEEAIIKIKGEALIEKEGPRAFMILIRLEGIRPEEVQNVKRGITTLNHSKAEPMRLLKDVLCQAVLNPFRKACFWKKVVSFLGSLQVPLQHVEWKPDYIVCFNKKEEGDGQWHAEIRLTNPFGNIYDQGFVTKKTSRRLSKYHKLSDIMSPNWFQE